MVALLTLGVGLLWFKLRQLSVRYRVTSERIVVERGLLGKRLEQTDLYRVVDFVAEQPFGQRLVGTGNLLVKTVDRTTPDVHLRALPTDVRDLYERLRAATEATKRRNTVRLVDYE